MDGSEPPPNPLEPPPLIEEEIQYVPLERIPFPRFVKFTLLGTLLLFAIAAFQTPAAFNDGIAFERAKRAISEGHPADAVTSLARINSKYPLAQDVRLDLVRAYLRTGDIGKAIDTFNWFEGKEFDEEEWKELEVLSNEISAAIDRAEAEEAGT